MLNINLNDKVALITGGSKGVGKGIAEAFAKAGANVIINYSRGKEKAEETVQEIRNKNQLIECIKGDVSDPVQVKSMINEIIKNHGKIDILVNNAGVTTVRNLENLELEELERVIKINTIGSFVVTKEVLPHMLKNNEGNIIMISSTSIFTGGGGGPHYSASKAALTGLIRSVAKDYGPKGIRINGLAISLIATELLYKRYSEEERNERIEGVPIRRLGTPEDVGNISAFLASDLSGYVHGEIINVDGGRLYG